jgi:hypothetical protein
MTRETTMDASAAALPELSDERIDEIEAAVFARIGGEQAVTRTRRRRGWVTVAAAAAAVVLAVAVAPVVGSFVSVSSSGGSDSSGSSAVGPAAPDMAAESVEEAGGGAFDEAKPSEVEMVSPAEAGREIIASGSATVRVTDVAEAVTAIAAAAESRGGYVESSTVGGGYGAPLPMDQTGGVVVADGGSITVRVPSGDLQPLLTELAEIGEVEASGISRQDVTTQVIDLRARVEATQASVTRLTELLSQSASVADLIAAESALAERQATLESYQQQLTALDEQVDLSSLTVSLVPRTVPVDADPAGFGDGLAAGWNGLVATVNGIVVGLGFLLPWIVVASVTALVVWGVVRLVRRARRRRTPPATSDPAG